MALDIPLGALPIDSYDFMIYLVMRHWAKPCTEVSVVSKIVGSAKDSWLYELQGHIGGPKRLCSYIFNVDKRTRRKYIPDITRSISSLICANLVICCRKSDKYLLSSSEFAALPPELWQDGRGYIFYFEVPSYFYGISGDKLDSLINYCFANKELQVDFFLTAYAIVEYYFSISKDADNCWMLPPVSTYFTDRKKVWSRAPEVFNAIGIFHEHRKYTNESGEFITKQVFSKQQSQKSIDTSGDEEGVSKKPKKELPHTDKAATPDVRSESKFSDTYKNDEFAYSLAVSFEEGRGFPKTMITADKWDVYDMVVSAYGNWKEKQQNIS